MRTPEPSAPPAVAGIQPVRVVGVAVERERQVPPAQQELQVQQVQRAPPVLQVQRAQQVQRARPVPQVQPVALV